MVVAARPDELAAVLAHLRASTDIAALASTRITSRLQPSWSGMPTYAVIVRRAGGPPGKRQINVMRTRMDVFCYGATEALSVALWRQVDAVFCPGQERLVSFTASGCRVYSVDPEAMPASDLEPGTEWPRTTCSYIVSWCGVSV
jgi:hypothetical protein